MKLNGSPQLRLHNEKSDVCWPCLYYLQNTSCQPSDTYAMRCPATSTTISGVWWHWRNVGEQPVVASQQLVGISIHQDQQWCRGLAQLAQSAGPQGEAQRLSAYCIAVLRAARRTLCPSSAYWSLNVVSVGTSGSVMPVSRNVWSGHVLDCIQRLWDDDVSSTEEVFICLWTGASSLNSVNAWLLGLEHY